MELWLCIVIIFEALVVGWILGWFGVRGLADKVNAIVCDIKLFLAQKWLKDCGYIVNFYED